jgi:hypothetical protein
MIHHLVNRLPIMICPRWVYTKTQPIGITDVLRYLLEAAEQPKSKGKVIDIGGPEILTYRDIMLTVARVLGLKRTLIQVPVLTPRLSSYWVNLVTPIPAQVARPLIEGLKHETVCENDEAAKLFDLRPLTLEEAVRRALARVAEEQVETFWTDAASRIERPPVDPSHLRIDTRQVDAAVPPDKLFDVVASLGGHKGWLYADRSCKHCGFIDQQLGGVGLRRGRRHPRELAVGDALDFWRVEEYIPKKKLVLLAEMKVWGQAWLDFEVISQDSDKSSLLQTARFYPRGLFGLIYWYSIFPLHALVFKGLARRIVHRAESSAG